MRLGNMNDEILNHFVRSSNADTVKVQKYINIWNKVLLFPYSFRVICTG